MKKIPATESDELKKRQDAEQRSTSSAADGAPAADQTDGDDPVAGLQADLDRFRDLAMRSRADFENYKKRSAREKEEAVKYANTTLLGKLVSIADNFELGLEAARGEGETSPIYSGMNLVLKQLQDFLAENGLRPIDAVGQKFDPNLHEAIAHEPSSEVPEGVVIRQTRRGYRLKDRLLRPSAVVVSSGPKK
ncbi:MAG TPA: nucleotide exchange factor GrpE [Chthoniobacterales bacterium]|nr:nucleotide exchange factor GrpE [Chthoniobacterales bacterium]